MSTNYDSVLAQLQAAGIILEGPFIADGKVRRTKVDGEREKRGWYLLHEWKAGNGNLYIVGSYGVWRGADNGAQKIDIGKDEKISAEESAALRARLKEDKKRAQANREAEARRAAGRASAVWSKSRTTPPEGVPVDYLTRKAVQAYGLRYTDSGALVVPMQDGGGKTHGLQFILPGHHPRKKKTGRDKEYWPAGLAKQGHFYLIGSPSGAGICLIAEGYATAATLHAATGLPVAVAFDAGNLLPVAQAIRKSYKKVQILICADDDYLTEGNPGCSAASSAALAVNGAWVAPEFPADRAGQKLTDYNDLQQFPSGGLALVRSQIEAKLKAMGWQGADVQARGDNPRGAGEGEGGRPSAVSNMELDDLVQRFIHIDDDTGEYVFDIWTKAICKFSKMVKMLPARVRTDDIKDHPTWKSRAVYLEEVGFDPTGKDTNVKCNRWAGWPTTPKKGSCTVLLTLLEYLCSGENNSRELYKWVLKWLAYPIQHPGAKMHSAIVVHGQQGTGKSRFFESYGKIFGEYGLVLNQGAIEDKFNADWSERKLYILADEIVARADMFHLKNQLKNFITGEWVRVNPKNVAAHRERNHMNIVFLSNEKQPVVLENDDRRHCVIWTPQKLDEDFYNELSAEIDGGGIEALHHYLLNVDLTDFHPWTKPPMTQAKRELIDINRDSVDKFITEWREGCVEINNRVIPFIPCLGNHLHQVYQQWCNDSRERSPRNRTQFIGHIAKLEGWSAAKSESTNESMNSYAKKNRKMVIPGAADVEEAKKHGNSLTRSQKDNESKAEWLTACFFDFANAAGIEV